jgi:anti-anti-sigma factor
MDGDDDRAASARVEAGRLREESQALRAESEQAIRHSEQLRIRAERLAAHSYLLTLSGELDVANVRQVVEEVDALRPDSDVTLELAELEFIDSSGLRLLLDLTAGGDGAAPVRLRSPSPAVMRLAELTGTAARLGL